MLRQIVNKANGPPYIWTIIIDREKEIARTVTSTAPIAESIDSTLELSVTILSTKPSKVGLRIGRRLELQKKNMRNVKSKIQK